MHKDNIHKEQEVNLQLSEYFEQARKVRCPSSMKRNLYHNIRQRQRKHFSIGWPMVAACSFICVMSLGLFLPLQKESDLTDSQKLQYADVNKDMQVAMHYMEKVGLKALSGVNTHGIIPGIIKPVSKSVAQI